MIRRFRHKGLKLLFEKGDRRKVQSDYADKIERILARLEEASEVGNMDLPGFRLHPSRAISQVSGRLRCPAIGV